MTREGDTRSAAEKRLQQVKGGIAAYIVGVHAMRDATSSMQDSMREVNRIVTDATTQAKDNRSGIADDDIVTDNNPISWAEVTVDGIVLYIIGGGVGGSVGSMSGPVGMAIEGILGVPRWVPPF